MKHIFILNPSAGSGEGTKELKSKLEKATLDYEIYEVDESFDATVFVREYCERETAPLRFYACGGDGTVRSVAAGLIGFENASMSVYPIGSGNDFVKFFGGADDFLDIESIVSAEPAATDIMHIKASNGSDTYSINVCNIGFEAAVARTMGKVRRKPLLGGKNAYTTGIVASLFTAMKNKCEIYADGQLLNKSGVCLLCAVANGGYVGGGYHCAPRASVSDGLLEVCLVKPLSLLKFLKLIGSYKAGTHLDDSRLSKYLVYTKAKRIEVKSQKPFAICLDGEVMEADALTIEVLCGKVNFASPEKKAVKV